MVTKSIKILLVFGFFLGGCKSATQITPELLPIGETSPLHKILIDIDTLQESHLLLSDILDDSKLIRLETSDKSLLGSIADVKIYDQKLFVHDENGFLFAFDINGKFLFKVGTQGKGPGEFLKINSWGVDRVNDKLLLLDDAQHKLLFFDMEGGFLEEERFFSIYSSKMACVDGNNIVFYNDFNTANANYPYALLFYSLASDQVSQTAFPIELIKRGTYISESPLVVNNGSLYFKQCHSYEIYELNDTTINSYFSIDFGEHNLPKAFLTKEFDSRRETFRRNEVYEQKKYVSSITYDMTDDYIQYQFSVGETIYYGIYSKNNEKNYLYNGVINDLYELPILGINMLPNNMAYSIVNPGLLYEYKEMYNRSDKYKMPAKMQQYLSEINISDNPALIIGKIAFKN